MKKILLGILLWCIMPVVFSQDAGFVSGFAIINKNGAGNDYFCLTNFNCGTNPDFHNQDFGLVVLDTDTFILNGAEINNYTCNFETISPVSLYFRVYRDGETPGAFTLINIFINNESPFTFSNGCNGANMRWETFADNQNILAGITAPGTYFLELYVQQETSIGTQYLSNGGANYRARFEVVCSLSPLNGTYDIPSPCFPTMASAVNYLNIFGISGPVTFNVASGYTETAPPGGFRITGTGTAANPVVFQKSGVGANPTFIASDLHISGRLNDAVFKLVGSDYITFDGFTLLENTLNTDFIQSTNNMTEYGLLLINQSTTNGSQFNTVKNCTIQLNKNYPNSIGIMSNSSVTDSFSNSSGFSNITVTNSDGSASGLKIVNNTISNVNLGVVVVGAQASAAHNDSIIIGSTTEGGNSIFDFGTMNPSFAPNLVSGVPLGVYVRNTKNFSVVNNSIVTSDNISTTSDLRAIFIQSSSNAILGESVNSISNNSITVRSNAATSTLFGIHCVTSSVNELSTLNINNNTFTNFGHSVDATSTINFIFNSTPALNVSITGNTIENNLVNTSGTITFFSNNAAKTNGSTHNFNSNIVRDFSKISLTGSVIGYNSVQASTGNVVIENMNNNIFENINIIGSSIFTGISNTYGNLATKTAHSNTFNNIQGGTGNIILLNVTNSDNGNVYGNTISNIFSQGDIQGINTGFGSINYYKNTIYNFTTSGPTLRGIRVSGGNHSIYQNKIYNLTSTDNTTVTLIAGIRLESGFGVTIFNNVIGQLYAPQSSGLNAISGIHTAAPVSSNYSIFHNTIFLDASSTGSNFGTSGIFNTGSTTATSGNVILRNNLVVNNSVPNGTGITASLRRGTTNNLANYNSESDYNAWYVPEGPNRMVFRNNTSSFITLEDFQTTVSPREQNSVYEEPIWESVNPLDLNYLKLQDGPYPSQMESGGLLVTTPVTIDFDHVDEVRPGGVGVVNGGGQQVDIGAYEFDARPFDRIPPVITYTPLTSGCGQPEILLENVQITDIHPGATGVVTSGALVPRVYYRQLPSGAWQSQPGTLTSGDAFDGLWSFTITGLNGGDLEYFVIAQDNNTNLSAEPGEGLVASDVLTISAYPSFPEELYFPIAIWAGSWIPDDAAPTAQTRVVIMAPYDTSIHGSFVACDCIVEAGASVVIDPNDHITLQGGLNNQGSFTIQNSGSLVQVFDQPNVGSITVERIANNVSKYDFIYWSSPVENYALSGIPGTSSRFRWNPVAPNSNNGLGNWISYSGIMEAGSGYIVRAPNSSPIAPATTTLLTTFNGVPHNGTVPVTIERGDMTTATVPSAYSHPSLSVRDDNFNLLGNPYPSAIHAENFLIHNTITNPVLDGTLRLWTHGTVPDTGQTNPFFGNYTYNYSPNDYIIFNLTGTISGPAGFGGYVASGQGFFVLMNEGDADTATVEFTNAMRSSGNGNNQFYRMNYLTSSMPATKHRIWLDLVNSNGSSVRTLVGYIPGATHAKDVLYDAWVKPGNHLNLYSLAEGETLAIQGRPVPFQTEDLVPLGFVAPQAGNYSITIAYADGLFAPQSGQSIYLEDKLTGLTHLLNSGPYAFYTDQGRNDERFELRYEYETLGTPGLNATTFDVLVSSKQELLTVKSKGASISEIKIYDLYGRKRLDETNLSVIEFHIQTLLPTKTTLMVVVSFENGLQVIKKVVH
jgi:hypothetical protein